MGASNEDEVTQLDAAINLRDMTDECVLQGAHVLNVGRRDGGVGQDEIVSAERLEDFGQIVDCISAKGVCVAQRTSHIDKAETRTLDVRLLRRFRDDDVGEDRVAVDYMRYACVIVTLVFCEMIREGVDMLLENVVMVVKVLVVLEAQGEFVCIVMVDQMVFDAVVGDDVVHEEKVIQNGAEQSWMECVGDEDGGDGEAGDMGRGDGSEIVAVVDLLEMREKGREEMGYLRGDVAVEVQLCRERRVCGRFCDRPAVVRHRVERPRWRDMRRRGGRQHGRRRG